MATSPRPSKEPEDVRRLKTVHQQRQTQIDRLSSQAERAQRSSRAFVDFRRLQPFANTMPRIEEQGESETERDEQTPAQDDTQRQRAANERLRQQAAEGLKVAAQRLLGQNAARFILGNPYVLGAIIIVVVIGGVLTLMFAFAIGSSGTSAADSGTSTTVPFETGSGADRAKLATSLSGNVTTSEEAQKLLAELARLKPTLAGNEPALRLVDEIETAAKAIIAAKSDDTATIDQQARIIKRRTADLEELTRPAQAADGSCAGVRPCLDVPTVAEGKKSHCGRASVLMALLYINQGAAATRFREDDWLRTANGKYVNKTEVDSCVEPGIMSRLSPANRGGWLRRNWVTESGSTEQKKQAIIQRIIRSLNGGDPVVIYLERGGAFRTSEHIMTIIGYDETDEPAKGGTFVVNNPDVGYTTPKTKTTDAGKLTAEHIKQHLGGNGPVYKMGSIIVRSIY